uniref:PAN domain protein n=1 Tax=Haemonchus contortus TaxID=6289 RepID=A0A7I5EAG3_HAECO
MAPRILSPAIINGPFTVTDLITLLTLIFFATEVVAYHNFVIENYSVVQGNVLGQFDVLSLGECSLRCLAQSECAGFNYFINNDEKAQCLLVGYKKAVSDADLPLHEAVLYGATRISLDANCSTRTFAFEKLSNMEAQVDDLTLESTVVNTTEQCLGMCQKRLDCRAAQFNRRNLSCDLLVASPNTVYNVRRYFVHNDDVDLYENNCVEVPMSSSKCNFMRLSTAGYTDLFDEIVTDVAEAEECERICVTQTNVGDPCRSYTHDSWKQLCYLSHYDGRGSGRSPLNTRNKNLTYGSLDDCIDFALKCRNDALEIRGSSMRLFSGSLKTKRLKDVICERTVTSSYQFSVFLPYKECGIEETTVPFPSYSGLIHVKEGSTTLVTIRDKLLQVHCHIHPQVDTVDQAISTQMEVHDTNRTDRVLANKIIFVPSQPPPRTRYSLRVLNMDDAETDVVHANDEGWLSLTVNEGPQSQISVSNMVARDINTKETIKLINDDGCVVHNSILGISRPSSREVRYKINFGGFHDQAQLIYQALVETCTFDCYPKCNQKLWLDEGDKPVDESHNTIRRRRAIGARQIELTQDIYKVHGSRITVVTGMSSKHQRDSSGFLGDQKVPELRSGRQNLHDDEVHIEVVESRPISSALEQCFSDDITCLFTVILASIQLFLLASCLCIVYCYIQQWRSYRSLHEAASPVRIEYELNGQTDSSKLNTARPQ